VESVLFASGRPLAVGEISEAIGLSDFRPVQRALRTLQATYENRQTALEVRRVGDRYALQLREEYVPAVQSVTPVEMAPRTLKTLTLIAYHQPILQSILVRMTGDTAYEEVQRLRGMGLIHTEAKGSTLELSTSRRFAECFGIGSTKPEEIRHFLERKLGVAPPSTPPPTESTPSEGADAPNPPEPNAPEPTPVVAAPTL
ncbi:MAG: SMC-Scp complex subunit ScpB, partial [Thermoplasmata archaeon]